MDSDFDSGAWDCMIVGAGPAGLNAALVLGRTRRRVLVLDSAQPRNYATHEMHGVLGHVASTRPTCAPAAARNSAATASRS